MEFTKRKQYLNKLIFFSNKMTSLVDEAIDVFCFNSRKAFNTISYKIYTDKVIKCRLNKWTIKWTENRPNCQAKKTIISSTKSSQLLLVYGGAKFWANDV